jgi:hypothetical protein
MTTLSLSVNAQDKQAVQNIRFAYYTHNKVWDSSNSTAQKVKSLVVDVFKYIANACLAVVNAVHSKLFTNSEVSPVVAKPQEHIIEKQSEDFSLHTTIDVTSINEVDDEGVPAEEKEKSWLSISTAVKTVAGLAIVGGVGYVGYQYGATSLEYIKGLFAAGTPTQ